MVQSDAINSLLCVNLQAACLPPPDLSKVDQALPRCCPGRGTKGVGFPSKSQNHRPGQNHLAFQSRTVKTGEIANLDRT